MAKCKNCINLQKLIDENNVTIENWCFEKRDCVDVESDRKCKHFIVKTNADRIRTMSDEELADFFDSGLRSVCIDFHCEECNNHLNCDLCYLKWLQSEAE